MDISLLDETGIAELNASLLNASPREILATLIPNLGRSALSFSGAEDVVTIEHSIKAITNRDQLPEIFTLDTGRLPPATQRYLEVVRAHYGIKLDLLSPDPDELREFVRSKGLFSFYEDGHTECCGIRKVAPLRRHLANFDAWITGQRRDQSPTRSEVAIIEIDRTFSTTEHRLIKVNPLANTTSEEVWNTIRLFDIPYNELHDHGYVSIGCEPCTKAIGPNQHEREGRWWWEESTHKECGLHITTPLKVR